MKERTFNNADSFAMAFDDEWQKIECDNETLKIQKIIKLLSEHPFVKDNPEMALQVANFRVKSLKKFNQY